MSHARDVSKFVNFVTDDFRVSTSVIDSDIVASSSTKSLEVKTGIGTKGYATPSDLPANAPVGSQGFVTSNNRLYISNGSGWYNIALINRTPYWITQPNGSYALDTTGQATVITILGGDSDGYDVPQYTATGDSNFNVIATVTKDSDNGRVFIVSAIDSEGSASPVSGSGTLTFTLSDGKQSVLANSTFSIDLGPNWSDSDSITVSKFTGQSGASVVFGKTVTISGDGKYALINDWANPGGQRGSVDVYVRSGSTWSFQVTLVPSDVANNDYFGGEGDGLGLNHDGSVAIIGKKGDASNKGATYFFTRSGSTWTQQQKITASDGLAGHYFGTSVSIDSDGTYAVIGAPYGFMSARYGAAYIFYKSGSSWTQQQRILASDVGADDYFGMSTSISKDGNYVIVSAQSEDGGAGDPTPGAGAAYVYVRSGSSWANQQKLVSGNPESSGEFGTSVSINSDGTYAIVGAMNEDGGGFSNAGAAYIFTRSGSTWTQQAKLLSSDIAAGDAFGLSVALNSDATFAVIGAYGDDDRGNASGSAYIFKRSGTTWTQQGKLIDINGAALDFLGDNVAISSEGKYVIVGGSGQALIFEA